jgi:hypothetical protein
MFNPTILLIGGVAHSSVLSWHQEKLPYTINVPHYKTSFYDSLETLSSPITSLSSYEEVYFYSNYNYMDHVVYALKGMLDVDVKHQMHGDADGGRKFCVPGSVPFHVSRTRIH